MPELGLGFTFWQGTFLDVEGNWLRFTDEQGQLLLTGKEQVTEAKDRQRRPKCWKKKPRDK